MATANDKDKDALPLSMAAVQNVREKAKALALEMGKDDALTAIASGAVKLAKDNKLSVGKLHFAVLDFFEKKYEGQTVNWLDMVPRPGVKQWDLPEGSNRLFDRFKYKEVGSGNTKETSFWRIWAENHPFGAAKLAEVKRIDDKDGVYAGRNDYDNASSRKDEKQDFEVFLQKVRAAVNLHFAMAEANEKLGDKITVDYCKVDDNIDLTSPQFVCVIKLGTTPIVASRFTADNFMRLSPDLALAKEGTYEDFIKSNARGTPEGEAEQHEPFKIGNSRDFVTGMGKLLNYLNGMAANPLTLKTLIAEFRGDDKAFARDVLFNIQDKLTVLMTPDVKKAFDADDVVDKAA